MTTTPRPRRRIAGSAARIPWNTPRTLTSHSRRTSSGGTRSRRPRTPTPAAFTQTSIRPYRSSAARATRVVAAASVTSAGTATASARACAAVHSLATSARASALRAVTTRRAPHEANARATARPIPLDAPVTTTTSPGSNPFSPVLMRGI